MCFITNKDLKINDEIRESEVRLIDADGTQLGIVSIKDAQRLAISKNLDLVKIASQANPPVCKIMDYGKYRFELTKKEKEIRKNQKIVTIKEIRISPSIDEHDLNTKVNNAAKFLNGGDKVKVTIKFRGREINHSVLGINLLKKIAEIVAEVASVEKEPKLEGKNMSMILSPKQK